MQMLLNMESAREVGFGWWRFDWASWSRDANRLDTVHRQKVESHDHDFVEDLCYVTPYRARVV